MSREFYEDKKARRNARIAHCRFLKNLFIWFLGVIFIPVVIVVTTMFVPLKMFTGSDGSVVSEELSEKSLFNVATTVMSSPENYGVKDFPIILTEIDNLMDIKVFNDTKISDLISVDKDKLKEVTFGENVGGSIIDCFKVTATIDSVGITDSLGDFGKLSVFKEYTPVTEEVNQNAADFNYKLYYYKVSGEKYAPAFEKNGETVTKVSGEADLYYPNLIYVPLPDIADIFSDRMGTLSISSLLNTFGVDEGSDVMEIFGEKTLKELSDFDFNEIKLSTFLDTTTNKDIYDILCAAVEGEVTAETLTIGDLNSGIVIDNVKLSVILDVEGNEDMYDILCAAVEGEVTAETITVGDLNNLDINRVQLKTFLNPDDNEELYDILCGAIGGGVTAETLTVGDFSTLETDNIKVSSFLNPDDNEDLYDILCNAITKDDEHPTADTLLIGDLKLLDVDDVKLSSFLDPDDPANDDLYAILLDTLASHGITDKNDISLGNMKNFDTSEVKLIHVIVPENAPKLYEILEDVTGKETENIILSDLDDFSTGDVKLINVLDPDDAPRLYDILRDVTNKDDNGEIKLSDLNDFSTGNVKLANVLDPDDAPKLYDILEDVTDKTAENIKLSDLNNFTTGNIKLTNVLAKSAANEKLYDILEDVTGTDADEITLSNLTTFSTANIKLANVLDPVSAPKLYTILGDVTGKTAENIVLSDLNGFATDNIKLAHVIDDDGGNNMLRSLLDRDVTVGNIATELNNLSLYEVYGKDAFTTTPIVGARRFNAVKDGENNITGYTANASGDYYLDTNAGTWLILCYNVTEYAADGSAKTFEISNATVSSLQDGSTISAKFKTATVRHMIDAGLVDDPHYDASHEYIYALNLNGIVALLGTI